MGKIIWDWWFRSRWILLIILLTSRYLSSLVRKDVSYSDNILSWHPTLGSKGPWVPGSFLAVFSLFCTVFLHYCGLKTTHKNTMFVYTLTNWVNGPSYGQGGHKYLVCAKILFLIRRIFNSQGIDGDWSGTSWLHLVSSLAFVVVVLSASHTDTFCMWFYWLMSTGHNCTAVQACCKYISTCIL